MIVTRRFFYDFEFIDNGVTIIPISLGIVTDYRNWDNELYLINKNIEIGMLNPWLIENVWPYLPLNITGDRVDITHPGVMSVEDMGITVDRFIGSFSSITENTRDINQLWAYYGAYDHVCLSQLFGTMLKLTKNIPMFTHELMQLWEDSGKPKKPAKPNNAHNALADAKWNMELYNICIESRTKLWGI